MSELKIPQAEDGFGVTHNGLIDPLHFAENWVMDAKDEVVGTNNTAGTAVLSIEVPNNQILMLFNIKVASKVAAATFIAVQSTTAAVGGTETILDVYDLEAAGYFSIEARNPQIVIKNTTGSSVYCNIYLPHNRAGSTSGNNDATSQYVSASCSGILQ